MTDDRTIGAGIAALMRPKPPGGADGYPGSQTLEVQDVPPRSPRSPTRAAPASSSTTPGHAASSPRMPMADLAGRGGTKFSPATGSAARPRCGQQGLVRAVHRTVQLMAIPQGGVCFLRCAGCATMELRCARLRQRPRAGERGGRQRDHPQGPKHTTTHPFINKSPQEPPH